ncbi:MAG: hypothetical protein ACRDRL_22605, partial [Sciscionella sp.]
VVTRWDTLVERAPLTGDATHRFDVESDRRYTHLRLIMHPDGGIARLRAHGRPIVDPRLSDPRSFDLAARCNGAEVVDCSDMFYSSPANMLAPGFAAHQAEGWETARRRDGGNDWVLVRLACTGTPRLVELDTSNLKGNAPGWAALSGCDTDPADPSAWRELLPRTRLQPDTAHRFRLPGRHEVNHLKLDIYPDGGLARLRLWGALSPDATGELLRRWFDALPRHQACQVLADVGVSGAEADRLVDARPMAELPAQLRHDIA